MTTRIRDAELRDLSAVTGIERVSLVPAWSERDLAPWLDARRGLMLVADADAIVVGYALFLLLPAEAELLRLAVAPDLRRRGVGRLLVTAGLQRLASAGRRSCLLEVRDDNRAAVALYGRLGFRPHGRRADYYADGADALLFRFDAASGVG